MANAMTDGMSAEEREQMTKDEMTAVIQAGKRTLLLGRGPRPQTQPEAADEDEAAYTPAALRSSGLASCCRHIRWPFYTALCPAFSPNIYTVSNPAYPGVVFKIALDDNGLAYNFNDTIWRFCLGLSYYLCYSNHFSPHVSSSL